MLLFDKIVFKRVSRQFWKILKYEMINFLEVLHLCMTAGKKQCIEFWKSGENKVSEKHGKIEDNIKLQFCIKSIIVYIFLKGRLLQYYRANNEDIWTSMVTWPIVQKSNHQRIFLLLMYINC